MTYFFALCRDEEPCEDWEVGTMEEPPVDENEAVAVELNDGVAFGRMVLVTAWVFGSGWVVVLAWVLPLSKTATTLVSYEQRLEG